MPQVLFQPAGNQGSRDHYRDTIEQPVPFARLEQFLDPSVTSQLRSLVRADGVATWGVTPGRNTANQRKWERIATGDIAVFLREGRAYSSGVVALTARNARLAEDLWGRDEFGQTWEYLYFLQDVRACDVSYRDLNRAARYEAENRFQGFNILDPGRAPEVIQLLGRDSSEEAMDSHLADKLSGAFAAALRDSRLVYSDADVARFVAALLTKPFVILSGLSGSGKTKLAQALGYWLGRGDDGLCALVVPVGPDWTSVDNTLGYPNALDPTRYSMTDVLKCVLDADARPELPHILVLDEMNLSHVERYFADILSAMESGEQITLYSDGDPRGQVPQRLTWPRNVFVVGTVNIDETTYMFSPKVLDRANVIEFRVDPSRLMATGNGTSPIDLLKIEGQGARFARLFVDRTWIPALPPDVESRTRAELAIFFDVLAREGHEFAYRTASEIARFVAVHRALVGGTWTFEASFDAQVIQKLLPRLHGSRRSIASTLIALAVLCSEPRQWIDARIANFDRIKGRAEDEAAMGDDLGDVGNRFEASIGQAPYKLSLDKVVRMLRRLDRNGFVSFAEA